MENWSYFNTENLKPLRTVNRYDDKKGNRFYYFVENDEVQVAAGITSCFGKVSTERYWIDKWKEETPNWRELFNASSDYGTMEHELFADIALGRPIVEQKLSYMEELAVKYDKSSDMPRKDMLAFMQFCEDMELEPLIIEGVLVWQDSDGNWLAMTIDMLAKLKIPVKVKKEIKENVPIKIRKEVPDGYYKRGEKKGQPKTKWITEIGEGEKIKEVTVIEKEEKIIVVDFKSNFFEKDEKSYYETHKMQLIGAAKAVQQNFGIKVDEVYNWSPNNWRTNPSYTFYKHNLNENDLSIFDAYWNLIKAKGINSPTGKMLVTGLKNASDFKFVTYREYVAGYLMGKEIEPENIN